MTVKQIRPKKAAPIAIISPPFQKTLFFSSYFPLIKEIDAYIATPIKINNPIGPAIITHLLFKIILSFLYCL